MTIVVRGGLCTTTPAAAGGDSRFFKKDERNKRSGRSSSSMLFAPFLKFGFSRNEMVVSTILLVSSLFIIILGGLPSFYFLSSSPYYAGATGQQQKSLEQTKQKPQNPTVLFIVMGEALDFEKWYELLGKNYTEMSASKGSSAHITLLYGSYDTPPISFKASESSSIAPACINHNDFHCHTRYIPNTTWTEGRNQLAAEALLLEHAQHYMFDYWILLDEDVDLVSNVHGPANRWTVFLEYLLQIGEHGAIATLTAREGTHIIPSGSYGKWTATYTPDAALAAVPRHYLPYILPYATLPPSHSQWISQAVVFCVLKTCFTDHPVLYAANFHLNNPAHRPYQRNNMHPVLLVEDAKAAYDAYVPDLAEKCRALDTRKYKDIRVLDDTLNETLNGILVSSTTKNASKNYVQEFCIPLERRFQDWERTILEQAGHGVPPS